METEQPKIYQHHTPRQYLLAWADADERIAWLGYGKVSRSGLTVVGGENDFYRLKELTVPDVDCLKLFIDGLPFAQFPRQDAAEANLKNAQDCDRILSICSGLCWRPERHLCSRLVFGLSMARRKYCECDSTKSNARRCHEKRWSAQQNVLLQETHSRNEQILFQDPLNVPA